MKATKEVKKLKFQGTEEEDPQSQEALRELQEERKCQEHRDWSTNVYSVWNQTNYLDYQRMDKRELNQTY